jgi:hypothetical protein
MTLAQAREILGGAWSAAVAAVYDPTVRATPGGVQQYVWQSIRNDYLSRGEPLPAGAFQAVNALLSLAGQQRQASLNLSTALGRLERTGIDSGIGSEHIAPAIDSTARPQSSFAPQYRAIYRTEQIIDGERTTSILTHDFGFDLPQSASELQAQIEDAAQIQAADYGFEWGGEAVALSIQSY